jgi:Ser/Thr protein kinase RdoA (MazF antagonist)
MAELEETMTACGRWLQRFHGFDTREGRATVTDLRAYIDVRLRRLVEQNVISSSYRERILQYLNRLARQVSPTDLREVTIHADLAPANILVCATRIVVLDFAMAGRGSYLHDISRLFLQLDVLRAKPQFRTSVIAALQSALLRGLDPALTAEHPLFRYLLMLHRINHLGTLALRRERFPSSVLSARVRQLHRQWIDRQLAESEQLT